MWISVKLNLNYIKKHHNHFVEYANLAHKRFQFAFGKTAKSSTQYFRYYNLFQLVAGSTYYHKLYEDLISEKELPYTYLDGDYIFLRNEINEDINTRLKNKLSSQNAEEMNESEMRHLIENVNEIISSKLIEQRNYWNWKI